MSLSPAIKQVFYQASVMTGAFFCLGLALVTSSCGEDGKTPTWTAERDAPAVVEKPAPPVSVPTPADHQGLRFMCYNVENWLTMERGRGGKPLPKPEVEKQAVVDLIVAHRPDVIGLSEVGTPEDVGDLLKRLEDAGLKMRSGSFVHGSDPHRAQALLSRFPVVATAEPEVSEFRIHGRSYQINRGILDATVERDGVRYRFVGVHLKSKREVPGVDQAAIRLHEARLLRRHVDSIFKRESAARLVVYGDFNDTRRSPAMKSVVGNYGDVDYLTAIPFRDSRGHVWTHHWDYQDVYSRIDFVTVSPSIKREVDFDGSYIVDDPAWSKASDHRPLMAIFRGRDQGGN